MSGLLCAVCRWNAAVLMCVMLRSVSDLALEAVSGLSSTYWLLGHISRIKIGQGVVLGGTGFWG